MFFAFGYFPTSTAQEPKRDYNREEKDDHSSQQSHHYIYRVVRVPGHLVGLCTKVGCTFVAHHILRPEDGMVQGGNRLVSVQTGQSLHIVSVTVLVEHFPKSLLKAVTVDLTQFEDFSRSPRLQTEQVVKLVKEQWYAQHWYPIVYGLLDSIGSSVSHKHFGLRVAQEVLLGHPVHYQCVVAQRRGTLSDVPPNHLLKSISRMSMYIVLHSHTGDTGG